MEFSLSQTINSDFDQLIEETENYQILNINEACNETTSIHGYGVLIGEDYWTAWEELDLTLSRDELEKIGDRQLAEAKKFAKEMEGLINACWFPIN